MSVRASHSIFRKAIASTRSSAKQSLQILRVFALTSAASVAKGFCEQREWKPVCAAALAVAPIRWEQKAINLQGFRLFLSLFLKMRKSEYNNFSKSGAFCSSAPHERRSLSYPSFFKNGFFTLFYPEKKKAQKRNNPWSLAHRNQGLFLCTIEF